ncbi:DUF2007 domain-containing protein [Dysgonomonas sp. Marseille-P4677]|uniref:putative signal transducing protein n=1 Tax=Dysgonomonas sp. Marseille-P4677 TaxID=2364790 RepID=UPI001913AF4E|nr:DUF2007 domain-containing protein [Dysgonomonas sp. Marseille-P4677]MBK5721344.1 DUF2007 domain-containing protein [Dysgonomonas sp. Marseille-P4677]
MINLVTVKSSDIYNDISIAKTYLEDNGIFCILKDELTNQVHPYAIGGVKLQVKNEDVEEAIKLLIEGGFSKKEDFEIPESTLRIVRIYEKIVSFFSKNK